VTPDQEALYAALMIERYGELGRRAMKRRAKRKGLT